MGVFTPPGQFADDVKTEQQKAQKQQPIASTTTNNKNKKRKLGSREM